jgi:hypothetical protein
MSIIIKPFTFSAGATIVASEHNSNFNTIYNDYNGSISSVNFMSNLNLPDSQLAQITSASKVHGSAITGLTSLVAGAGQIPLANLAAAVPSGVIWLWSGSYATIPNGWTLCDGTSGTPDLRGRFVIAAGASTASADYAVGTTGKGTIPAHQHTYNEPYDGGSRYDGSSSLVPSIRAAVSGSTGTGTDVIAKFFALCYIMKI